MIVQAKFYIELALCLSFHRVLWNEIKLYKTTLKPPLLYEKFQRLYVWYELGNWWEIQKYLEGKGLP